MRFLVIAGSIEPLDLSRVGDAPRRANAYRAKLVNEGKIVIHSHVAGHRSHVWIYEVDGVDELDRLIAEDPMSAFTSGSPQILPLTSAERMAERAAHAGQGPA